MMRIKQMRYKVLLLTDGGIYNYRVGEEVKFSLRDVVHFAFHSGLDGIVCEADSFVRAPDLISFIKKKTKLAVMSYGTANNDPEKVKVQVLNNIDAIICDQVSAIHSFLDLKNLV